MYFLLKTLLSALVVAAASEISRRSTLLGAVLVSLPLTSLLAFGWVYYENRDPQQIITLSYDVAWLVLPSLIFFLVLPLLLKANIPFILAILMSCMAMAGGYWLGVVLKRVWM